MECPYRVAIGPFLPSPYVINSTATGPADMTRTWTIPALLTRSGQQRPYGMFTV